jgi:hypothetical protein
MKQLWKEFWEPILSAIVVMFIIGYAAYNIGHVRALHEFQTQAVEHGYGHYEASEAPANFRWNPPK